jgi:periplasmic protein CpxP/Spy
MKKLSLIAALAVGALLVCSTVAMAQDSNQTPQQGRKKGFPSVEQQMQRLTTELTLTDEQKPKVEAVLKDSQKKRQDLFSDQSMDRQERRDKMTALREEQTKKMKEILTPEQMDKYTKMMEEMKKGRKKKTD